MPSFNSPLLIGYDRDPELSGVRRSLFWDYARTANNACISGSTGTGKTALVKLICGRVALHVECAKAIICDFKHDDFRFLDGCDRYYSFLGCADGLDRFYTEFQARQSGEDESRDFRLLIFDEWASYLNTISDRKIMEKEKLKLATLGMLGRSFHFHLLVSQQRLDSSYFGAGARDQFGLVVALGNITKEAAQMFGFERDLMIPANGVGAGHMLVNGTDMKAIQVPLIRDFDKLHECIRRLVSD